MTIVVNQSCAIRSPRKNEFLTTNSAKEWGSFLYPEQAVPQRTVLPDVNFLVFFFFNLGLLTPLAILNSKGAEDEGLQAQNF